VSELPQGWQDAKIGNLITLNPKNECEKHLEVGFMPMQLLGMNYLESPKYEHRKWQDVRKGYTHFADNDVLLAKITPCFENGKAGIPRDLPNGLGAGSTEYFVCRPLDIVLPKYLLAFFKTKEFLQTGAVTMTGSVGHKRIPKDFLLNCEIPLPPLNEQKRIADKLDSLLKRVDTCRERLDRAPLILKRFRQAVLAAATSGALTEDWREHNREHVGANLVFAQHGDAQNEVVQDGIDPESQGQSQGLPLRGREEDEGLPKGWLISQVKSVSSSLKYGTSQKCSYENKGVPVLRIPNIGERVVSHNDIKYAELPANEFELLRLQLGDILVIRSNGSVSLIGKSAIVRDTEKDFAYAGYLIRIRPDQTKIQPEYLNLALECNEVRLQIEVPARSTSGVNNINSDELRALSFNLPPLPEQHEIVRRVEKLFAFADRMEARYTAARSQVETLTPSLLAKAFRGELVEQDPTDEPAAVLLERIRAQKESSPTKIRKRTTSAHQIVPLL